MASHLLSYLIRALSNLSLKIQIFAIFGHFGKITIIKFSIFYILKLPNGVIDHMTKNWNGRETPFHS